MGSSQTVLSFQLAGTDESLTAQGGLALFGEYLHGFGVGDLIDRELPAPGSAAGYSPSVHVLPLVLTLAGGGRTLEDLRVLRRDEGLRTLLPQLNEMPSSDATGDWLRRIGAKESGGLVGLQHVNGSVFRRLLLSDEGVDYTLDIDATQIVAEKHEAHYTYKGEKGYMPMVGHIAELGVVIGHEFREGNAAPAAGNLEFLQACERNMPKGKRIVAIRADSAAYQAAIFNWCEVTGKVFAIGADQDAAVKAAIAGIPESDWKTFRDGEIAETIHCMNKTDKAFRLIVLRRPREQDLFEDNGSYRYHAIASNRADEDAATTMQWYCKRGDASENRIKDLKIGFGMEYMPCGTFHTRIYSAFRKWQADGCFDAVFAGSVLTLHQANLLDTTIIHGDGTTTSAKKGGDNIGFSGHKKVKGDKIVAFCDRHCNVIAPFVPAPGNRNESPLLREALPLVTRIAASVGLDLQGTIVSLDGVYDCRTNRKAIFNRGMIPNINANPRGRKTPSEAASRCSIPPFLKSGSIPLSGCLAGKISSGACCFDSIASASCITRSRHWPIR